MMNEATAIELSEEQRSELERRVRSQTTDVRVARRARIDAAEIVRLTTQTTQKGAAHMGISDTTVHKAWKAHGLKPHLVETFKVSRDPKFAKKLENIVG